MSGIAAYVDHTLDGEVRKSDPHWFCLEGAMGDAYLVIIGIDRI